MHEVYPSLQGDSSLSPQFLCRIPQRSRRSLIIRHTGLFSGEQRLVKALGQVSPVRICHFPHSPDNASESTVLHRRSKMKRLVRYALFSHFRSMTARKECEFSIRKPRLYNVQQRKTRAPVKLERSLEWLSYLKLSMACEMGKPAASEALDYGGGCGLT